MSHIPYRSILALPILLAILVFTTSGFAQSGPAGSLTGSVQDPNGAHLPGVSVTVRSDTTGASRSVTTDSEGRWTIPGLAAGSYQITYELAGFNLYPRGSTARA